jgi:hypothetical protein
MCEPMRKWMGRSGRSLRRAMESERSQLLRQGFGDMTGELRRWIHPKRKAPGVLWDLAACALCPDRAGVPMAGLARTAPLR